MKHTAKRLLSLLLVLIFCVSLFPSAALAEEPGEITPAEEPAPPAETTEPAEEPAPEDPEPEVPLPEEDPAEEPEAAPEPGPVADEPQDDDHIFVSPPETGDADPDDGYTVTWETNFTPTRVVIVKRKLAGSTYSEHAEVEGPYSTSMSYHFDYLEGSRDYNYLVYAYYDGGVAHSTEFRVYNTARAFTVSPSGGTINPGGQRTLSWTTNFTPTKVELLYWNRGETENDARTARTFTNPGILQHTMNVVVTYDQMASSPHWVVAAYYGTGEFDYVTSEEFTIRLTGHEFTSPPADCSIEPDGVVPIQWSTNFVPTKVQIGYCTSSSNFFPQVTITSGLGKTMGQFLDYKTVSVGGTWCVAAYYAENKVEFSPNFTISKTLRGFTEIPADREVNPGESTVLSWETNFEPSKIELCTYHSYNGETYARVTLTEGLSSSMSYELDYSQLPSGYGYSNTWLIRAYHDDGGLIPYVSSEQFQVTRVAEKILEMPEEFRISSGGRALLTWETNFVPVKVEIKAKFWGDEYYVVKTITTGLDKRMTANLSAAELTSAYINATSLSLYVYPNSLSPVTGGRDIQVVWLAANKCGDNLTWELDEEGTLTISGTGPMWDFDQASKPWDSQRSAIRKVVIAEGATTVGEYAFYNCSNLIEVNIPTTMTEIGMGAFLLCENLRTVNYDGFLTQAQQVLIKSQNEELERARFYFLYRSGRLGDSDVYWEVDGAFCRLTISGSGGSGIHMTPPWLEWVEWIDEIEIQEGIDTVWEDAFRDCSNVVVATLPRSLQLVEDGAFASCTELSDVYFNGPLSDWTSLSYHIRANNDPLLNAEIHTTAHVEGLTADLSWSVDDAGLLRIFVDPSLGGSGDETDIPDYSVGTAPWYADYASDIVAVRLESGVTGIGKYSLSHLSIQTVEIADTVTFIGNYAFEDDGKLAEIIIPDGLTRIGDGAFQRCGSLTQIHLPDSVTTIGSGAFNKCSKLTKVWLPGQLASIPNSCFENCRKLQMVSIPVTVTGIGGGAFNSCSALIAEGGVVYYGGSSAQWTAISGLANQYYLKNAWVIHFVPEEIAVNDRNFPDENFRTYVSDNLDTDGSGYLNEAEIADVENITDEEHDITTLKGIEYFTDLVGLLINAAPSLTSVDLRANTALSGVDLSGCGNLAEVQLDGLTQLTHLYLGGNALTEIDLRGLNALRAVAVDENPITRLDLTDQTALQELYVSKTSLTELDLSAQSELYRLYCAGTGITALDLSGCPLLCEVIRDGTRTVKTEGDLSYVEYKLGTTNHVLVVDLGCVCYTELEGLLIDEERFPDPVFRRYVYETFDADRSGTLSDAELAAVKQIHVDNMDVHSLQGIEYFTELEELSFCSTYVTAVDLSANTKLSQLECYSCQLTELDLSANTALSYLDCDDNPNLTSLNVSGLSNLSYIEVSNSGLTELDVSDCPLTYLECDCNPLTSLTLGEQEGLGGLICYSVELGELDISGCPILVDAWLNGTHTECSWGLEVNGSEGLGGYMELDLSQKVKTESHTPGDINGDGKVTVADVTLLAKYVKARGVGVEILPGSGNVDGSADGKITVSDVTLLAKYVKARGQGVVIY